VVWASLEPWDCPQPSNQSNTDFDLKPIGSERKKRDPFLRPWWAKDPGRNPCNSSRNIWSPDQILALCRELNLRRCLRSPI
jgi:hypothetical protein